MKSIIKKFGLAVAAMAIIFTGCKDDEKPAVIPTFSPEIVVVQAGNAETASITGTAPFEVTSASSSVATASVNGNTVTITGVAAGSTTVTVTGSDGGSAKLGVTVRERDASAPTLSASAIEIDDAGQKATVTISGGTPAFTVTSAHPNIASVALSGTTITVTGESMGATLVTVKGSDNASATFAVSVGGEQIFFGPDRSQIGNGDKSFTINRSHTIRKGVYTMVGWIYVADGAVLTIEPGTIIKGTNRSYDDRTSATGSSLIIQRGAKIIADGKKADGTIDPIVFTSAKPKGQRQATDWGGIIICGRASNNLGTATIEGGVEAPHGGNVADDNSGVLRYVRLEFGGYPFSLNNEINGLTMGSVGSGTTIEYVQVSYAGDDSYEWFGGTVNAKYLIAYKGWDDDFDTDNGFSGKVQYALSVRDPKIADTSNSNSFESDNNASGATTTPLTKAIFSNVTVIGPIGQNNDPKNTGIDRTYIDGYDWGTSGDATFTISPGIFQASMHIRRHSHLNVFNSVFTGFPVGLILDNALGNTQGAATAGDMKLMNIFFAGMGILGADNNSTSAAWTGNFSADYFNRAGGNNTAFGNIEDLKLSDNWGPMATSPLRAAGAANFDFAAADSFFDKVTYAGAFASDADADNWTKGWANFDPQNTDY